MGGSHRVQGVRAAQREQGSGHGDGTWKRECWGDEHGAVEAQVAARRSMLLCSVGRLLWDDGDPACFIWICWWTWAVDVCAGVRQRATEEQVRRCFHSRE